MKKITNHSAKFKIAEKAKEFITEDAVVFIDAGTTTYELAMQLEHMTNLVIVTNDIKIAARLSETHDNIIARGYQKIRLDALAHKLFFQKRLLNGRAGNIKIIVNAGRAKKANIKGKAFHHL